VLLSFPPRRGVPLALIMCLACPLGYIGRWTQWLGVWSETQAHVGVALIIGLPVAAGLAGWSGYTARRTGLDLLTLGSGRSPHVVIGREQLELAAWITAGFLAGAMPAYVATAVVPHSGSPSVLSLIPQVMWVCSVTAMAAWIGRRLPWFLGAPACAVLLYIVLGLLQYVAGGALAMFTPLDARWTTFHRTSAWALAAQGAFCAMLWTAVLARRARFDRAVWSALWLAGIAAAPLLYAGPTARVPDAASAMMRCTTEDDGPIVCLPEAKAYLRPRIGRALSEARTLLAGLVPERVSYVDDEAAGVSRGATTEVARAVRSQVAAGRQVQLFSQFGDLSGYTQLDSNQLLVSIALSSFPVSSVPSESALPSGQPPATTSDGLVRWFLQRSHVPIDGTATPGAPILDGRATSFRGHEKVLDVFSRLTPEQRLVWFRSHRTQIETGTLMWSAFDELPN
jgi:hypothetical protein